MSFDDEAPPIVIDNGTGTCKAGFAGEDAPYSVFSSVVGRPKYDREMSGVYYKDSYVGDEAQAKRGVLSLKYPIEKGVITDWDDMELIWDHVFQYLRVSSDASPVLLTDSVLNPTANREKMVEVMIEKFNVPGCHVVVQSLLSLYASGRGVGLMVDCGEGGTQVVPVHLGYAVPHANKSVDLSGSHVTSYLARILNERGYSFTTSAEKEIVKDMKEKLCYVAKDFDAEMATSESSSILEQEFELPDGNTVVIGSERFRAPECLFTPSLIGKECPGIHEVIDSCLKDIDIDLRRDFYTNIILSGGSTMFPGIEERLTKEMKKLIPDRMIVKVVAPPERKYSVWIGGSIMASLSTFEDRWLTKEEYEENGPRFIHTKTCL